MVDTLSSTQKAWLTGFIDGEGFIGILFQRKKENSTQSASPLYHPFLVITNNNRDSILYVRQLIGEGKVYCLKRNNTSYSPTFQYKLAKRKTLAALLREISPYFIIKRRQSELILEFIRIREGRKIITGGGSRGKTSFSVEEEEIYRKLLILNRRGGGRKDETTSF